ncbi:MAG: hypothetical protein IJY61_03245 [Candidatus Gastranaerophilales bacterium]|nr:hypothetical protein [Candidatus Gastranaerophilales bacterium]
MRRKVFISSIFFLFITIVVATVLSVIVTEPSSENAGIRAFYKEPQNQIDVVIIGPSSTFTTFLPLIAYHKYGITGAVYALPGMVTEQYIHVVKEVMEYQTPKVLLIAIDNMSPLQRKHPDLKSALKSFPILKPSINKIKILQAFKKELNFDNREILEYYFPIFRFHSRWKTLRENSVLFDSNPHKGALIYFKEFYEKNSNINPYESMQRKIPQIDEYRKKRNPNLFIRDLIYNVRGQENSTDKEIRKKEIAILQYVKAIEDLFFYVSTLKNTKVVIIETPSLIYDRNFERIQYIFHTAKKYGLTSFYMGNCKELNIDLNNEFVDEHHLNFFGAYKATDYLSNLLINKYGLKDKRNDSKYKSWDEEYEFYRYFIRSRYNVDIDFDYLKKL